MPKKAKPNQPKPLAKISPIEFANRFVKSIREQGQQFSWFFGAGCSVSSGIPAASGLVEKWSKELFDLQGPKTEPFEEWCKKSFSGYDPTNLGSLYAAVLERRHPASVERQREIEMICSKGEPSYGYATFAQILSLHGIGEHSNIILTTNFDDLIADALYMYGDRSVRPQTITHEALARFVRIASPRPTIIKLHGDAHLDPKNLTPETREIGEDVTKEIYPYMRDRALVFVGYGGHDESIFSFFNECPLPTLAPQIYWVGKHDPAPNFLEWLSARNALRVDHTDFDRLMHHLRGTLAIGHPDGTFWEKNYKNYLQVYELFEKEVTEEPESVEKSALKQVSDEARSSLPSEWEFYTRAISEKKPEAREAIYLEGIAANPDSARLLGSYALFLVDVRKDLDAAETFYKRAIEADPKHANNLGNYANFLADERKDPDAAETFYKRAIESDPKHATNLGNYANFLADDRKNFDAAETFYKRAIEADPKRANNLSNYANFLAEDRKDRDAAEPFYKRAIEANPKHANSLGSFAFFLANYRKDLDSAETLYKRAIEAAPKHANSLGSFALFLADYRKDLDAAETFYKRAIEADPKHANNLGNYAVFLANDRKDFDAAETFYRRAIAAAPKRANNLANFCQLLFALGRHDEATPMLHRALELVESDSTKLELAFYRFVHIAGERNVARAALKNLLLAGARSEGWSFESNIERAKADQFPELEFAQALADVISCKMPIETLDRFDEWKNTPSE